MYRVTVSPESTRPPTRRSLRERGRRGDGSGARSAVEADAVDEEPDFLKDSAVDASPAAVTSAADTATAADTGAAAGADAAADTSAPPDTEPVKTWADAEHPTTALTWLDPHTLLARPTADEEPAPALFAGARLPAAGRRVRLLLPIALMAAMCATYVGGTLTVPLDNVAPTVTASPVEIAPAPAATVTWPGAGSASVAVQGMAPLASTTDRDEIASITKVATVAMVLEKLPLKVGEQGPGFSFTRADHREFQQYRRENQSSLDVPVGGSLSEYQMLQGVMLGSANNYIDRLARELWGSERAFADASAAWLRTKGIDGISLDSPSGFDKSNVASPEALLRLGEVAMRNPVFAEIVSTRSADIPGVGTVTNTNQMLDDPGVIGVKTGTLSHWNLLTAKEVTVNGTTVRLFASVLGQNSNNDRLAVTRSLLAEMEKSLAEQPAAVPKGAVVGSVETEWGAKSDLVTDADTRVVLWNGATANANTDLALGSSTKAGAKAGTLSAKGPINTVETPVSLAKTIAEPTAWWRLTHPLELFGLDKG